MLTCRDVFKERRSMIWIFLMNFFYLIFFQLGLMPVVESLFIYLSIFLIGCLFLDKVLLRIEDRILCFVCCFLIGISAFTFYNYFLFHFNSCKLLRIFNWIVFSAVLLLGFMKKASISKVFDKKADALPNCVVLIIAILAFAISLGTTYGFFNGRGNSWGWNGDRSLHLFKFMTPILKNGLPGKKWATTGFRFFI